MLDTILNLDRALFLFINGNCANLLTDFLMPLFTNDILLRVIYGVAMLLLIFFGKKRFIWVVVFSALVIALCDQLSSSVLKPFFDRPRPCHDASGLIAHLLVNCGSGKSFPSSHAANLFGQAAFFSCLFRRYSLYLFAFAIIVGLSRIFVGVHYPLDVLGGAIIGIIIGATMALILKRLHNKNLLHPAPYINSNPE